MSMYKNIKKKPTNKKYYDLEFVIGHWCTQPTPRSRKFPIPPLKKKNINKNTNKLPEKKCSQPASV